MVQKLIIFAAVVAVASAVVLPAPAVYPGASLLAHGSLLPAVAKVAAPVYHAPALLPHAVAKVAAPEPYDPNPQYSFSYDVHDASTGDFKTQQESRSGDVVQGAYSLIEPDGTKRLVEYTADPVHGFNAVVHKEPVAVKAVAPIAKVLAPAPLIAKVPLAHAALPIAHTGYPLGHAGYPLAHAGYPLAHGGYPLAPAALPYAPAIAKVGLPAYPHYG